MIAATAGVPSEGSTYAIRGCATYNNFDTRSARVEVLDGYSQRAPFHTCATCGLESVFCSVWAADRPNQNWDIRKCIDLGRQVGHSFESFPAY
jgi:hypothetical protein